LIDFALKYQNPKYKISEPNKNEKQGKFFFSFFFFSLLVRENLVIDIKETRKTKAETRKKQWGRHEKRNERHDMSNDEIGGVNMERWARALLPFAHG
jgi:hypothetical protein